MVFVEDTQTHFAQLDTIYDQRTTVHHWQLKNLVACESSRFLYCVHEFSTVCYDTLKQRGTIAQTLDFAPHCLTVGHGYLAAGGHRSQLNIRLVNGHQEIYNGRVGGAVNNSLHITESPLGLQLFVCNNDKTIKVFSLPQIDAITNLRFPVPVNYSASTQDAIHLLSVGDSSYTYLHQASEDGYRPLSRLEGYTGVGMCCAWDPQGVRFSAASQDGTVCVWDRRSAKSICSFKTPKACRSVKFSSFPMDLMAFTEESGACHLVDARHLRSIQVLRIAEGRTEHDISGLCFTPQGHKLFVGTKVNGIYAFDIDTAGRRRFSEGSFL